MDLTYAAELAHAWNRILLALGAPKKKDRSAAEPTSSGPSAPITYTTEEMDVPH